MRDSSLLCHHLLVQELLLNFCGIKLAKLAKWKRNPILLVGHRIFPQFEHSPATLHAIYTCELQLVVST